MHIQYLRIHVSIFVMLRVKRDMKFMIKKMKQGLFFKTKTSISILFDCHGFVRLDDVHLHIYVYVPTYYYDRYRLIG